MEVSETTEELCQLLLAKQLGQVIEYQGYTYCWLNNTLFVSSMSTTRAYDFILDKLGMNDYCVISKYTMNLTAEGLTEIIRGRRDAETAN